MPETPAPSSSTVEEDDSKEVVKRKLVGEAIQLAKRGVTFQIAEACVLGAELFTKTANPSRTEMRGTLWNG